MQSQFLSVLQGVFFSPSLFPGLKYSILSHTLALCVVDHAINPITTQAMSTEEATATQHNGAQWLSYANT